MRSDDEYWLFLKSFYSSVIEIADGLSYSMFELLLCCFQSKGIVVSGSLAHHPLEESGESRYDFEVVRLGSFSQHYHGEILATFHFQKVARCVLQYKK